MAAPANSGESDMATEDFCSTLQLCLTPSQSRPFLPSSNSNYSMVMQYQGSNQSMDNPLQIQQWHEEDMVDLAPDLAEDSALLQQQQQQRQNGSEASDWRSRGGIMKTNNQGFEESNMGFQEESEEMMTNCISFPLSPTDFPMYLSLPSSSNSTAFSVLSDLLNRFDQNLSMLLSDEPISDEYGTLDWLKKTEQDILHIFKDRSGASDVINELEQKCEDFFSLSEVFFSYIDKCVNDLDRIKGAEGMVLLAQNILQENTGEMDVLTLRRMNWFEPHDVDFVDKPALEMVGQMQTLILNRGGELDLIPGGGVCTINGVEHSDGQGLPMTMEGPFIVQTKFAVRVWLGYGGQWVIEIRLRQRLNGLNFGSFTTMEDTTFAHEAVMRWSGLMDLTGFPEHFQKANRSKLPLQLPLPAQEEKLDEDFGLVHCNAKGNDEIEAVGIDSEGTWDCVHVMAHQARLNLGKRKTKEKNPVGERRNKKTNGVRIAIPLEDILQTKRMRLKDAANHLEVSIRELESSYRDYGIQRWPPRNEHKLIKQSLPSETLAVVDQEGFPQLSSHTMPSNQALTVTADTNTFSEKEIPSSQFLPTGRQENPDAGFGNDEDEAIGMEVEGTREGVMVEAQFNSGCSGKGKWKEKGLGGERGNNNTTGVRIAIPKEDILRTKGMHLKDAAKHLEGGRSTLEHNLISCPNETPNVVDQEGIPQLNYDTLPSDQALAATVGTNSVVIKDILQPQFSLTDRQDNLDDDFGKDEVEGVGMVGEGTGEGKMEEGQLNSGCLGKGKRKEEASGGDKRNKKTNGVKIAISLNDILQAEGMLLEDAAKKFKDEYFRNVEAEAVGMGSGGIGQSDMEEGQLNSRYLGKEKRKTPGGERRNKKNAISLEDILRYKEMPQKVAATHLKVSLSTLKRACRGHGIPCWPPCGEHNQSRPNEPPAVVDKESIPQLNSDTLLPSNQVSATIGRESVIVKARFSTVTMKFQLSWPWRMEELKQQVEKRLGHEAENYYICYKDQDSDDDLLIACDEDLQDHISHSSLPGTNSIEVFLKPK